MSPTPTNLTGLLREAASLLREAAGHATPGPWRTHDTHLGGTGGHTATVLADRPDINDTELIAWLPTMSHEPWDDTRNAWRNAGWMALMDPGVGLALADWLERAAVNAAVLTWPNDVVEGALAVARRVLGTTTGQPATAPWPPTGDQRPDHKLYTLLRRTGLTPEAAQQEIDTYSQTILAEGDGLRARFEALAADWEQRGEYGDASLTWGARGIRAVLADEAQQPTPAETDRRRCAHTDVLYGRCVRFLDDHEGDCWHENYPAAPAVTEEPTP